MTVAQKRIMGGQGRLPGHYSVYYGSRLIGTVYKTWHGRGPHQWHAVSTFYKETIGPWNADTRDEATTLMVDAVLVYEKARAVSH